MTKRGRPFGWRKPAYAAVEELARRQRPHCVSDREAVRRAADIYLDLGDVVFGAGHPATGILPNGVQDKAAARDLAANAPRQTARMAKWEKHYGQQPQIPRSNATHLSYDNIPWADPLPVDQVPPPPPWPDTMLDSRDTVVDQITRRLPKK